MTYGSAARGGRTLHGGAAVFAFAFVLMSALWLSGSAVSSGPPADYRGLAPARLVDTRAGGTTVDGQQQAGGALGPAGVLDVPVLGRGGVPIADVAAVVLNLTVTEPTAPGWVAAFATGSPGPLTSNVNFTPGQTVANSVVAKVGAGGRVTLFNSSGSTHLVVDVKGWLPAATRFVTTTPSRLVDTRPAGTTIDGQTRSEGAVAAGGVLELPVLGRGGVPAMGVDSVILNLTATQPGGGYVTAYPSGSVLPNSSTLNVAPSQTTANLVIAKVGDLGRVSFYSSTSTELIVDVFGWMPTGSNIGSLAPAISPSVVFTDNSLQRRRCRYRHRPCHRNVNDAPSFIKGGDEAVLKDSGAHTVPGWATGISAGPANESGQAVDFVVSNNLNALFSVQPAVSPVGTLTYSLAAGQVGTATVSVRIHDDGGTANGGSDTSAIQTFSIVVSAPNQVPVAQAVAASVVEDTPTNITLTATDADGGSVSFALGTGPSRGSLGVISAPSCDAITPRTCAATVQYTPSADYNGPDSFTYTASDGIATSAPSTVSITVTPVNDRPAAVSGSSATNEDVGVPVTLTGSDIDDDNLTFSIVAGPTNGTLGAIGAPDCTAVNTCTAAVSYTPNANANGTDSFTFKVNDGTVDSAPATVSITVTAVNDAPSFTKGADQTVLPNSGPQTVVGWVSAFSPGPPDEAGQVVTFDITANTNPSLFAAGPLVVNNGTLTFTPATGKVGVATITLHAHDNGGSSPGVDNSPDQTFTIAVTPPNATPVAVSQSPSTNEDTPLPLTLSGTDADDDNLTFSIVTGPANGTLGALVAPNCTPVNSCTVAVTYAPNANYNGPDSFTFKVNDGTIDSANGTVSIAVNAVNDAPALTQPDGTLAYTENALPTVVAPNLTVADVDGTNLASATIQITGSYANGQDVLSLGTNPQSGITAGAFNAATGTLSLTGSASVVSYQAALRDVRYVNTSDTPTVLTRTISFTVNDGALPSNTVTRALSVTAVNDPPAVSLDTAGTLSYTEQAGFINLFGPAAMVTDVDSPTLASLTVSLTSGFDAAFDTLDLNSAGFSSSFSAGTLTITKAGGTPADYTTALRNVRFRNTSDDPDHRDDGTPNPSDADRTVSVVASDGPANSPTATRTITINPVNDAPGQPTTPPATSGVRNTTLVSGANTVTDPKVTRSVDLKGGSVDPDGLESNITVVPASAAATTNAGRITLTAAGDLRYEPPASVTLAGDTYGYQLTDGTTASASVAFTVTLSGEVWYVADQAPSPGDGTSARPFDTLAGALAVATTNDAIHIRRAPGDGILTAGVTLQSGQKLLGEGVALTNVDVGTATAETLSAAGTKPVLTASNVDVVTLAATTQIAGLTINPDGTGGGLAGASVAGATVRDVAIDDTGTAATQPGIELTGTGNGLTFTGTVTVATTQGSALSITNAALGGTLASVSTSADTNGPGVNLTTTTGSLTMTTVALTTTNQVGFLLNNSDSIDVLAGAVSATNRPAVDAISLDSGSDLTFTDVDSASSTSDGVNLDGIGTWTFSAGVGSTITGATTVGFDVNGGSGTVTYAGSIANSATAEAVEVTGRSGNTTISGNLTGSGGTGLNVANNTAGTTTFSGPVKRLDTGANTALTLNANTGHSIAFSGGGLDIKTTSGAGFSASGGGTVTVQGAANTISTGTGTAVSVTSTTIGAGGITLQSVSTTGAANGILLNSTGTVGSLTVTGAGGTCTSAASCTGGAIQNATVGVTLTSTKNPSFDRIAVLNTTESGIKGTGVDGVTITNSKIDNSGSGHVVVDSSNIGFNTTGTGTEVNLTGVVTITGNTLTNAWYQGIDIFNYGGTISDANISNNTITSSTSALISVGSGIRFVAFGGPLGAGSITKATLNGNSINNIPSGVGLQVQCGNANSAAAPSSTCGTPGSATNVIAITNNGINAPGGGSTVATGTEGVIALVNGVGQGNFNISNNDIRNTTGTSISSSAFGNAVVTETISNNTVVSNNTVASQGIGIGTSTTGGFATNSPQLTSTISGNSVSGTDGNGILAVARDSSNGQLKVKILSNIVAGPVGGVRQGIRIDAGNLTGDNDVCAQISGNTSAPTVGQPAALGIGLRKQLTSTTVNAFGLVGLSPSPAASPAVEGYVSGLNPSGGGTLLISATSGFTSCPAF